MNAPIDTKQLKAEAHRLGFSACGVAPAEPVDEQTALRFKEWIAAGKQGEMNYLTNYTDKRLNPALLMEGAQSMVCVALNYYPARLLDDRKQYEFARYAYGKDYHEVMKARFALLLDALQQLAGRPLTARLFCDTAPVLERYWAARCGLGWIGKHTQLVIPRAGTHFFLGELLLDVPFTDYDRPLPSRCGNCTRCIESCPTRALEQPYTLNASRCLSYLTIEYRGGTLPPTAAHAMGNCIYGCDRCQQACPWNRFATPTSVPEFAPTDAFMQLTKSQLEQLTPEAYRLLFKGSAIKRAKYEGLMRNVRAVKDKE